MLSTQEHLGLLADAIHRYKRVADSFRASGVIDASGELLIDPASPAAAEYAELRQLALDLGHAVEETLVLHVATSIFSSTKQ